MSTWPLMLQPLQKYAEFNGRSRRSEFWLWVLFRILIGMAIGSIAGTLLITSLGPLVNDTHPDPSRFLSSYFTFMPLLSLINLGLLLPSLAVGVRRLHDIGRTGWWLIMPMVVMTVGMTIFFIICGTQIFTLAGAGHELSDEQGLKVVFTFIGSAFLFILLPLLIAEIVMLVFYVTEGKRGPNRFGEDPKGHALNDTP